MWLGVKPHMLRMPSSSAQQGFGDTVHAKFPCSKLKLDNLFLHWLSLQETQKLVGFPLA